jgi:hypothetical protein
MPQDVSVHLHFDADFLDAHPTVHVYFHLKPDALRKIARTRPDVHMLEVRSDWPQDGKLVRVDTSHNNSICAYGNAFNASGGLAQIKASIYQGACPASPLQSPPDTATPGQVIAVGSLPADPQANYYFPAIPGAACDSSGSSNNCLVIWAQYYGCTGWETRTVQFNGFCSSQTDCSTGNPTAPIESFCPGQYRLWIWPPAQCSADAPEFKALAQIASTGPLELRHCSKRSTPAAPQWFHNDESSGEWSLRMTTLGGQSRAVLKCHRLPNVQLISALLWETKSCEPYDSSRLVPVSPLPLRESQVSCVIEPA